MIWYEARLVRALQEARLSDRRSRPLRRRPAAPATAVSVALRPAAVR